MTSIPPPPDGTLLVTTGQWDALGSLIAAGAALVATVIALRANRRAREANVEAERSNDIAADALSLARSAESRADRLEKIATERRDVRWESRPIRHDIISFENHGTDVAHDVVVHVDIDGRQRREFTQPTVEPRTWVEFDLSADARPVRDWNGRMARMELEQTLVGSVTITWKSSTGVPSVWNSERFRIA